MKKASTTLEMMPNHHRKLVRYLGGKRLLLLVVVPVLLLLLGVGTLQQQVHTLLSKSLLFDRKESEQSIHSKLGQVQFNANNREYSQQKTPAFDNWQLTHEDLLQIKSHNASSTLDLTHLQQWPYGIRWLFMILKS